MREMKITVVVPVMNEKPTLERLVQDVIEYIAPHRYRIIFVDDDENVGQALRRSLGALAVDVAHQMVDYLTTGAIVNAVNTVVMMPSVRVTAKPRIGPEPSQNITRPAMNVVSWLSTMVP